MNDFMKYLDEILSHCILTSRRALQSDKERVWNACALEYEKLSKVIGDNEELLESFSLIVNDILLEWIHAFLVAMDGGAWISEKYRFDIVDKENGAIINEKTALHEEFFDYLWEKRSGDPLRNL